METVLFAVSYLSLIIHIGMIGVAVWRVWRGENVIDRLIATELVATLMLAVLILVSVIVQDSIYIDVALGLGALGFISTIALARYVADERIF